MSNRFSDLGINSNFQQSLSDLQISEPTDIQKKVIPVFLNNKQDLVALAKTCRSITSWRRRFFTGRFEYVPWVSFWSLVSKTS